MVVLYLHKQSNKFQKPSLQQRCVWQSVTYLKEGEAGCGDTGCGNGDRVGACKYHTQLHNTMYISLFVCVCV